MKKFKEKAQDYFDRHPSSNECHITSDGRVFHAKGTAQGFAGTLEDQEIESYSRTVLEKEKSFTEEIDQASDAEILAMTVFLGKSDVEKLEYNDLKKLVKFFDVPVEDQKKETLVAALTEFKKTLKEE